MKLARLLLDLKPDILHFLSPASFGSLRPWLVLPASVRVVVTDHTITTLKEFAALSARVRSAYGATYRRADVVHALNEDHKQRLRDIGLLGEQQAYRVIRNVVLPPADSSASMVDESLGQFSFVHVSGLDHVQKNVGGILRAFAMLVADRPHVRLVIVGGGKDKRDLERISQLLGLTETVTFVGELLPAVVRSSLVAADTLVMFSNREVDSNVTLEALSVDLPVITTNVCGAKVTVLPAFGTIVEPGDELALYRAMLSHVDLKFAKAPGAGSFIASIAGPEAVRVAFRHLYNS